MGRPKAGYGFDALRAWNEHEALVPQTHSLDDVNSRNENIPEHSSGACSIQIDCEDLLNLGGNVALKRSTRIGLCCVAAAIVAITFFDRAALSSAYQNSSFVQPRRPEPCNPSANLLVCLAANYETSNFLTLVPGHFRKGLPISLVVDAGESASVINLDKQGLLKETESSGSNDCWHSAVGDFNKDGNLDLICGGPTGVDVFLGDGLGHFQGQRKMPKGVSDLDPVDGGIAAGDFNRDGQLDIAAVRPLKNMVSIFMGDGSGKLELKQNVNLPGTAPQSVVVGDFNNDGILDIAVAGWNFNQTVIILLGDGSGGFFNAGSYPLHGSAWKIQSADFNRDHNLDLAVADDKGLSVLFGDGTGRFRVQLINPSSVARLAIGDFNGDSIPDIAVADPMSGLATIWRGDGGGGFSVVSHAKVGTSPGEIVAADLNADGYDDLAVLDQGSRQETDDRAR
jgi:hypothetical protein